VTQEEINKSEWENPDNWSAPIAGVYFSKRDRRIWVPKQWPGIGWTLNMGHRHSVWWLIGLIVVPPVLAACWSRRSRH
jgi:uncharacterized membrane protein